jgi:metal-responsive CopG/Arc/MetJ family transcriptional regulator
MKVSVTLPDALVLEVKRLSRGKIRTESVLIALFDYVSHQRLLCQSKPIRKIQSYSGEDIQAKNYGN